MPLQMKRIVVAVVTGLSLLAAGFWLGQASAEGYEPGSANDPLASKSYVDQVAATLRLYLDGSFLKRDQFDTATAGLATKAQVQEVTARLATKAQLQESLQFRVIEVKAGQQVLGEAGSEIVLRGGHAVAITSVMGGLLNVTAGRDIANGEVILANHLLIVPRSDGRGLLAKSHLFLMVKGPVTIK